MMENERLTPERVALLRESVATGALSHHPQHVVDVVRELLREHEHQLAELARVRGLHEAAAGAALRFQTERDDLSPRLAKATAALDKVRDAVLLAWREESNGYFAACALPVEDVHLLVKVLLAQRNQHANEVAFLKAVEKVRDRLAEFDESGT